MLSRRRALPALLLAAAAVVPLAGCAVDDGPRTTQTRDLPAFTRIDSRDSADLRLHVGEPQSVKVTAGRKVIDDVHTEVENGTLVVTYDHHGFGGGDVVIDASMPKLTAVATSGSGDVEADGIDADAFQARSDGSGDLALRGTAGRIALDVDGSGDADLAGLAVRDAHVVSGGSGDVDVRADERLDVDLDGSGDVRYHGHPAVTQSVGGSGDVSRAG